MPELVTPSPLASGVVGDAYSQSIVAEKVVDFVVRFESQTAEHNQSLDIGEVDLGGEQVEFFVDATPSPDDVFLGAASVSIVDEVGCTATVALQPPSLVETQSQEPFQIEVTPDQSDTDFSFDLEINNDGPDNPFLVHVMGRVPALLSPMYDPFQGFIVYSLHIVPDTLVPVYDPFEDV